MWTPYYEFFCHACKTPFSKTSFTLEDRENKNVCPHCGNVEQRWFYLVTPQHNA